MQQKLAELAANSEKLFGASSPSNNGYRGLGGYSLKARLPTNAKSSSAALPSGWKELSLYGKLFSVYNHSFTHLRQSGRTMTPKTIAALFVLSAFANSASAQSGGFNGGGFHGRGVHAKGFHGQVVDGYTGGDQNLFRSRRVPSLPPACEYA